MVSVLQEELIQNPNTMVNKAEIERKVDEILRNNEANSIPVDPVTLANRLGIKIHNAEFSDGSLSGMISKRGDNIMILVNRQDSDTRKRFTIAHELGHHFLHLMEEDGEFVDDTMNLFRQQLPDGEQRSSKRKEVEANKFAAALLMPKRLVKKEFERNNDLTYLAWRFGVSEASMGYRINELGLN
ncbi:ImmA/IrrE family metallo-endopeptidase [Hymenobacter properus]|uniref:ImmA/IrrE family metallo-endopeptidase n=1 Tax=Hymenobacter properus TaxID=2791026 RepID=A0A931BHP0_9BACT|nr:ImmA/IrrE family metallo-endopeptidase [Hymenobacter properus]MBF9143749.1 ImmA/IrrE family metallo-endopeptidase [Hymenobacter properus]MBR7722562.1 ImmA/IrrE family metallo-endopeptidase [Microvirga sp. SRT04]